MSRTWVSPDGTPHDVADEALATLVITSAAAAILTAVIVVSVRPPATISTTGGGRAPTSGTIFNSKLSCNGMDVSAVLPVADTLAARAAVSRLLAVGFGVLHSSVLPVLPTPSLH